MNLQIIAAALALALSAGAGWTIKGWQSDSSLQKKNDEIARLEQAFDAERTKAQADLAKAHETAREREHEIQSAHERTNHETAQRLASANALAGDLRDRLRKYEAARATATGVPRTAATTGTQEAAVERDWSVVLGTYGTADVDEAERADTIRIELLDCYAKYDAARDVLAGPEVKR